MGIAERIQAFIEADGTNPKRLARESGLNENAVHDILKGRSRNPRHDTLVKIAATLGRPVSALIEDDGPGRQAQGTARPAVAPPETLGENIPVLGHGRGGQDGFFFDNGSVADRVERPASLRNVVDAYAVYMHGDSQEPRIRHGELCYVHPSQPPVVGDDVVVQLVNDEGYIKTLVRRTAKTLVVSQYNPPKEIAWPAAEVRAVHRIVWIARTIR